MSSTRCAAVPPYLHVRTTDSAIRSSVDSGIQSGLDDGRDNVVVVMLHTLWRNGDMYVNSPLRARHLPNVRVIAPDLLGHGESCALRGAEIVVDPLDVGNHEDDGGANERTYSIERHALAVFNSIVREVRAGTPVILFGYSISGPIALCAAKYLLALDQYPLRAVVLVSPVLVFQCQPDRPSPNTLCGAITSATSKCFPPQLPSPKLPASLLLSAPSFLRNRLLARGFATKPLVFVVYAFLFLRRHGRADEPITTTNPDAVYGTIRSTLKWCPIESAVAIKRSGTPVLILDASKDALRANDHKRAMLLKLLGDASRHQVAPNSDHALMAHDSEFVYRNLAQFVY